MRQMELKLTGPSRMGTSTAAVALWTHWFYLVKLSLSNRRPQNKRTM